MKKKFFAPLMGAVVLGLSAYAGYRTYDAYNGVSESDLLLENAEALAIVEFMGCDCNRSPSRCRNVGAKGKSGNCLVVRFFKRELMVMWNLMEKSFVQKGKYLLYHGRMY